MFACFISIVLSSAFRWCIRKYPRGGLYSQTTGSVPALLNQFQIELQKDGSWLPVCRLTKDMREIYLSLGIEKPDDEIPAMIRRLRIRP